MTSKERILALLRGQKQDRVIWSPFLSYWWDKNMNTEAEKLGEIGFMRETGCDLLIRGHFDRKSRLDYEDAFVFQHSYKNTNIDTKVEEEKKSIIYHTPIGSLEAKYVYSKTADTWFLIEYPIKKESDFKVLEYIAGDIELKKDETRYIEESSANPDALFATLITPFLKSSFQSLLEYWVGTENLTYAIMDYPDTVDKTIKAMQETSSVAANICADSIAEVFLSWEDTSTTNISPSWYEKYIIPEINHWCDILHRRGKIYIQHACGQLKSLVNLIAESKIDAIESVSAPPTGNITPWELAAALPEHITVIGGIEPTYFASASEQEIEKHIELLVNQFKDKRFILANADSCPPEVNINRFGKISEKTFKLSGDQEFVARKF